LTKTKDEKDKTYVAIHTLLGQLIS